MHKLLVLFESAFFITRFFFRTLSEQHLRGSIKKWYVCFQLYFLSMEKAALSAKTGNPESRIFLKPPEKFLKESRTLVYD